MINITDFILTESDNNLSIEDEDKLWDLCWKATQNRPKKSACDVFGQKLKVNDIVVMFKNDNSAAFHNGNIVEFGFIDEIKGDKLTICYPCQKWGSDNDDQKFHYGSTHKYSYEVVKVSSRFYKKFV